MDAEMHDDGDTWRDPHAFAGVVQQAIADVLAAHPDFTIALEPFGFDETDPSYLVTVKHKAAGLSKTFLLASSHFGRTTTRYTPYGFVSMVVEAMRDEAKARGQP